MATQRVISERRRQAPRRWVEGQLKRDRGRY
jgi:hypothetical protein